MNSAKDPTNIVDLGSHHAPAEKGVGSLMGTVQEIGKKHLKALTDAMFERVDDSLFDLAEKAESNAIQTQYFDGMREVRRKRALIQRRFLEQVRTTISHFAAGHAGSTQADHAGAETSDAELSLVNDSELEESLAISSMTSKAQSRFARQLFAVNERLSVICGGNKVDDASNPLGPARLCEAFRQTARELDVETRVRLIIYKLFDRYVMAGLDNLYADVNTALAQAGVLPRLRHHVPRRTHQSAYTGNAAGAAERTASATEEFDTEDDNDIRGELYDALNSLLAARHGTAARGGGQFASSGGGAPSLSPAELLGALSVLQSEAASRRIPAGADFDGELLTTEDIIRLKQQLLGQVRSLRGDSKARVSGADEDTIDLVGMLFEFILADRNLPTEMQVLLARLQIPYLKAAILDRHLFAHKSHPARRLLDALADAAKGWSEEADHDRRLYGKIHGIVDTLLQDFDDDMDVFVRLEQELADFLTTTRKRADLSEQRVAEAVRGREKLQQARRRAAREILTRVDDRELPALVHGLLTRAWANYLVLTLLRQGEDSQEFRVALRFVDDFIWSIQPKQTDTERVRLRQLLPLLEKSLRHGLATVAFQDGDVASLMAQLSILYQSLLGEEVELGEALSEKPLKPVADVLETINRPQAIIEEAKVEEAEAVEEVALDEDNPDVVRVRALKVGNWVEFAAAGDGPKLRAKLSWISPISGKYLFVNRRGLKVADKTAAELVSEIGAGDTVILEELPLFDRALDAIVERLRQSQGQTQHDADPGPPQPATPTGDR